MERLNQVRSATDEDQGPAISLLVFELAGERYGLPSASVREIVRYRMWTPVPGAPPALPGIISQRGVILPIVELRALLNLPEHPPGRSARFAIVQHNDVTMALLAEAVLDLADIAERAVASLPGARDQRRVTFIRGVAVFEDRPLALLDLDALILALREGG